MNRPTALLLLGFLLTPALAPAQTLVAFGDSTTAPRGRTAVYSGLLASELSFDGKDLKVINAGIGGQTTKQAMARFEKDVLGSKPDAVAIQFGINDAAGGPLAQAAGKRAAGASGGLPPEFARDGSGLEKSGRAGLAHDTKRLYWTPKLKELYGRAPYLPDDPDGFNVLLRDYAEAVRAIARDESVVLVDVFAAFAAADAQPGRKLGWLCSDGMHPDDDGHRLVADLIIEHLAKADPRFVRKAGTVWTPSGEVNKVNPAATDITHDAAGPAVLGPALVKVGDGAVMSVYSTPTSYAGKPGQCFIAGRITRDGGKTWEAERELTRLPDGRAAHPTVHRTRDGSLHLFFLGYKKFAWKDGSPTDETQSDLWTARSSDGGQTWTAPQRIFEGYTGSTNGAEESRDGHLVVPFSHYVRDPGRLVSAHGGFRGRGQDLETKQRARHRRCGRSRRRAGAGSHRS